VIYGSRKLAVFFCPPDKSFRSEKAECSGKHLENKAGDPEILPAILTIRKSHEQLLVVINDENGDRNG